MQEAFLKRWERWDRVSGLEGRGGAATCCEAGAPPEGRWVAYLVYATAIGGLALLVLRRRGATSRPG
jgi:hypothetical protein